MIIKLKNIVSKRILRQPLTREEVENMVYDILPVGFVKGRIGKWRVRWQNGKLVVYKKADIYNASRSAASIKNRNNMGSAFRLAGALSKGLLKEIWSGEGIEGRNSYTRLIKHFRKTLKGNIPSADLSITPPAFHFVIDNPVNFDSQQTFQIKNQLTTDEFLLIVLVPFDPARSDLKDFEIITYCVSDESEIRLSAEHSNICKNYNKYFLYSVIIKRQGERLYWSNTAAAEGKFISKVLKYNFRNSTKQYYNLPDLKVRGLNSLIIITKKEAHPPPGRTAA